MITVKCRRGRADEFAAGVDQRKLRTPIDVRGADLRLAAIPFFLGAQGNRPPQCVGRAGAWPDISP